MGAATCGALEQDGQEQAHSSFGQKAGDQERDEFATGFYRSTSYCMGGPHARVEGFRLDRSRSWLKSTRSLAYVLDNLPALVKEFLGVRGSWIISFVNHAGASIEDVARVHDKVRLFADAEPLAK